MLVIVILPSVPVAQEAIPTVATGCGNKGKIVISVVAFVHPATLYVIVYVPPKLAVKFTSPVVEFRLNPDGVAEYVPPVTPVCVTATLPVAIKAFPG
jgi:hypothetical protein